MDERNEVLVVYDGPLMEFGAGLTFVPRDDCAEMIAAFDADACLVCNYDESFFTRDMPDVWSTVGFWCNRYSDDPRMRTDEDRTLAGLGPGLNVVVSEFHRRQLESHGINNTVVVPHGVDHDRYRCTDREFEEKENLAIFTSSYDRGGVLLENIWRRHLIQERTGVRLWVSPYGRSYGIPGADEGLLSDMEMTDLYKRAKWWLHPGEGVELFCLAGVKAQAASCTPIVVPEMALAETIQYGFRSSKEDYAENILRTLTSKVTTKANADHVPSWREATKMLWAAVMRAWR